MHLPLIRLDYKVISPPSSGEKENSLHCCEKHHSFKTAKRHRFFSVNEGNFGVKEKPMTIIRKMRLPIALFIIGVGAMGSPARASNWSMNGSSCIPNDTAANQYFVTAGSVTHRTNSLSRLIFYCPITNTWGSYKPTKLIMTYMDNRPLDELRREDAHITAQVIRLVASNGTLATISGVLHNDRDPELIGRRVEIPLNAHTFDFKNSYYYVRVDITRKSAAGFAKLFGVSLSCATCPAN